MIYNERVAKQRVIKLKLERKLSEVYPKSIQQQMKLFYDRLTEPDKRLYAALEAEKLGHGGIKLVGELLGCSGATINRGVEELNDPQRLPEKGRSRHSGGGRRDIEYKYPELSSVLDEILAHTIAGDPMNAHVKWTHLSARQIRQQLAERDIVISENTVRALLKKRIQ